METSSSDIPQPPKQSAYTQASNPISRTQEEQRRGQQAQQTTAAAAASSSDQQAVHRSPSSQPSSDAKLAQLAHQHDQQTGPEGSRGHIDLEYGVEQQPQEGYIARAVQGNTENTPRVQPGAHSGAVGSTPGYEQDTAAQMERKRAEHDARILGEDGGQKSPAYYGEEVVDGERRQVHESKTRRDEEVDVKGAVKEATGNVTV